MQRVQDGSALPANIAAYMSQSMTMFGWTCVDGIDVPFVQRDNKKFFPVRIAELKFLSQFANVVQFNVQYPLLSHYMHETEAFALSSCGCGESFTTQDLLVNLDEFKRFYTEVKEKCTTDCPTKKASVDGGWVQINNTVVPYVVKDDSVMVSLDIVRCAAGLLVGRDVPVVYPDENECSYLNDSCKSAGIAFDFTTATELIELVLMSCMCDQRPFIRQLPSGNPFTMAQPVVEASSSNASATAGLGDTTKPVNPLPTNASISESSKPYPGPAFDMPRPINIVPSNTVSQSLPMYVGLGDMPRPINIVPGNTLPLPLPMYAGLVGNPQSWLPNGSHSIGIHLVNTQSLLQDMREYNPIPSNVPASSASQERQFQAPPSVVSRTGHLPPASVRSQHPMQYQNPPVVTSGRGRSNANRSKQSLKEQWEKGAAAEKDALAASVRIRHILNDVLKNTMPTTASDNFKAHPLVADCTSNTLTKIASKTPMQTPSKSNGAITLHESATDEEKQMQISQSAQVMSEMEDVRAGKSLLLRRIQCYGKTITCMVKNDKLYILLEAMNRLYFPMRRLDTVIKAVVESLHMPVMTLTAEEERDFMKFYKLPAEKLNSNKVISVDDFIGAYKSLQSMLDNSFLAACSVEPKGTVPPPPPPADVRQGLANSSAPVPVGVPVMNVSKAKFHQSQADNGNAHSSAGNDRLPGMPQSQCPYPKPVEKTCKLANEIPKSAPVSLNAPDDNCYERPSKRCRTRVIGDVICIDD